MRQNGHAPEFTGRYDQTRADYDRTPIKPVLDGEPIYEDHPVSFNAKKFGHSIASDVRRPLYWDLFSGGFGHTYGHHSVWQMWTPRAQPVNNPLMAWDEAIDQPGAAQMQHGRALIESRPFLTRVPDDVIVADRVPTRCPGRGPLRVRGDARCRGHLRDGVRADRADLHGAHDRIKGPKVKAWWFNPRNGEATSIGAFANAERDFTPPDRGEMLDWVLVLDDASKGYRAPGRVR